MAKKLEGKIALVTGGTTGIGLATAKLFHEEGARVIVTGRNPKTLDEARVQLGGTADVVSSDAGDPVAIEALFADIARRYERLDVLFVNAGIVRIGTIEESSLATFEEVMRVNVVGPWLSLKYATPLFRAGGAVVLNASINARLGMVGSSAYAASKAALRSLGRVAAAELAPRGIRVNVLSPGPTDSGITEKVLDPAAAAAALAHLTERIVMKRLGTVDEVARAALFLASDDSSFMTGEEIVVDGGMTRV
ncbi:SDR family oxidoreductase [Pendulispora brunnea]|uniref:SDR family oxidoreductase n=1 Tax=Pendulispora brunnea TaxID=2905690 RepID=A0ABZ2K4I3_9BACT